jgi:hypothetical protein
MRRGCSGRLFYDSENLSKEAFFMMKKLILFPAGVLCLILSGCIFGGASSQPQIFSLGASAVKSEKLPCQVRFLLFRNLSGSDRRFLYRYGDNQVRGHEFSRWVLDPELLLERFLREEVRGGGNESVRIRGVITSFEFDVPEQLAVLAVDFTLYGGELERSVSIRTVQKIASGDNESGTAAAGAMEKCALELAGKLQQQVALLLEDIKKTPQSTRSRLEK